MMNRIFLSLVALFSVISVSATDYNMVILKNDVSKIVVPTADVEKVYFEEYTDSEENNLIGTWECVTGESHGADYDGNDFANGTLLKLLKGDKCFIGYHGSFEIYNPDTDRWETVEDPTENQWGDEDGEGDKWYLEGNNLTIMESDLDRYVGTIVVNSNEMTFTYKYQNWNYDSGTMTSESETYVSTFKKK